MKNFQNLYEGIGFSNKEYPKTIKTTNKLIKLAFMTKLKTIAIITS